MGDRLKQIDLRKLARQQDYDPATGQPIAVASYGLAGKRFEEQYAIARAECDVCKIKYGISSAASSRCYDCGDNLCNYCASVHRSTSQTANHRIVRIQSASYLAPVPTFTKEGGQTDGADGSHAVSFSEISTSCIPHGRRAEKYCTLCEEPLCDLCESDHEGHRIEALTDINRYMQSVLSTLVRQSHIQRANIGKVQRFLGSQRRWISSRRTEIIEDITRRADQMRKALDVIELRFKDEVEAAAIKAFQRVDADFQRFDTVHNDSARVIQDGLFAIENEANPKRLQEVQTKLLHQLRPSALTHVVNPTDVTPPLNFYYRFNFSGSAEQQMSNTFGALDNFSLLPIASFSVTLPDDPMPAFPTAIAINENSTILVADYRNGRVKLFGPAGESLGYTGAGSLASAFGLALLHDTRRFAVTDPKAGSIVLVSDGVGSTLKVPVPHGTSLRGLCSTTDGTLYAASPKTKSMLVFDAAAKVEQGVRFKGEISNVKRPNDDFAVGAPIEAGDGIFQRPTFISADNFGRVAVSDWFAGNVQVLVVETDLSASLARTYTGEVALPDRTVDLPKSAGLFAKHPSRQFAIEDKAKHRLADPQGVTFDEYGHLFIADRDSGVVHMAAPNCQPICHTTAATGEPVSLCATNGTLIVGENGGQLRLYRYA